MLIGESHHRSAWRLVRVGIGLAPAREIVADTTARQLLQQQTRDMPSTIPAHIDEQRGKIILRQETTVELGKAIGHHIGNMDIPDAILRCFVNDATVMLDPLTITYLLLIIQSLHNNAARLSRLGRLD